MNSISDEELEEYEKRSKKLKLTEYKYYEILKKY